jgi:hypothetical protein
MKMNKGSALVMALIIMVLVVMLATVGTQLMVTTQKWMNLQAHSGAEADNVSRAGLLDAISWFRGQTAQPVHSGYTPPGRWVDEAFYPRTSTSAASNATKDENIGLVKEYQLGQDNNVWGRYEVWRQTATPTNLPTDPQYNPDAVHDISGERLFNGEKDGMGYIWVITSKGYIYKKNSDAVDFRTSPNKIISSSKVSTEIRRITKNLQQTCAVIVYSGNDVTFNTMGRIRGNAGAIGRTKGAAPSVVAGSSATCVTNPLFPTGLDNHSVSYVLGVSTNELKILADYVVNNVTDLPVTTPDMSLVFINGDATFGPTTRVLSGSGLLFVFGNLTLNTAALNHQYRGLIYCTGRATIKEGALIRGCLVAYGGLTLSNAGAMQPAEIDYDLGMLTMVDAQICRYREMKSTYRIFTGMAGYDK